ncbi:glycoside hydrolase family 2 protein [Roseimarinus sediminis]|uniref:glycoside hydrolase family 2 protein n=1 Tax=Roseimarinus sediminis TaxID=1610899 RepID=UPI003D1B9C2B
MPYFHQHSIKDGMLLLGLFLLLLSGCDASAPHPIAPADGIVLNNNMPNFSWEAVACDYYELIIDGKRMAEVPSDRNFHTPFNLSFGEHSWQVIAVSGNKRMKSELAAFSIDDQPLEALPENAVLLRHNWKVKSSLLLDMEGEKLSSSEINTDDWHSTSLPSTVLSALVRNAVYPNPYVSLNNLLIPDANDEFNTEYDLLKYSHIEGQNPWKAKYWYLCDFELEAPTEKIAWLNLGEINYRAEVWLNGVLLADTAQLVGMEKHFRIDPGSSLKNQNRLAIAIYPPDHPGKPAPPPVQPLAHPGRNLGDDALITRDYTKWDVLGWDWQPAVRDRDMGITEEVYLTFSDELELSDLYVTSDLPLPDTTHAKLTISASLINHSSRVKRGSIKGIVNEGAFNIELEQDFEIAAFDTLEIFWEPGSYAQLQLQHPKLWWPHGYGAQTLYTLKMEALSADGDQSESSTHFGIREVETFIGSNERVYKINGQPIYMKGGNWVIDMMLNWTASRYEHEIMLSKAAGLNLLRVWGPTGAPPKAFFEAADRHGVLLWQDFLNDFWGTFKNTPGYTPNHDVFKNNTIAMVKKYRNHPSLVIWCGGNEGPNPREELIMNEILPQYDGRDTKHYLKISNDDGLHGGGPYHTLAPADYFTNPKLQGFSSELGPSGVPELESMKKFMNQMGQDWKTGQFPLNSEWTYHDATDRFASDQRKFTHYHNLVSGFYGTSDSSSNKGFADYIAKSQLVNYDAYRSCIEAINYQLWDNSSGYALWKSNSSWPSVVWQLYDWYLQAHSGFYASQLANEPVHIQLNRATMEVDIINSRLSDFNNVMIKASLYDFDMQLVWEQHISSELPANAVSSPGWLVPAIDGISFLLLSIEDEAGTQLSRNFYWLHPQNDFKALQELAEAELLVEAIELQKGEYKVQLSNKGKAPALMTALKLNGKKSGTELLPSHWSNNYFSLLPGESIETTVKIATDDLTEEAVLGVKAFNQTKALVYEIKTK